MTIYNSVIDNDFFVLQKIYLKILNVSTSFWQSDIADVTPFSILRSIKIQNKFNAFCKNP